MAEITMDTDWGARGAQLTGQQVQDFIKGQLRGLANKNTDLQSQINNIDPQLKAATDGCFVTYHRNSDKWPLAVPYWDWPALEKSGEVADGVLVMIDGQAPLVVAPTSSPTTLLWSKNQVAVNANVGDDCNKAYVDYTGKTRTAAIMAKATELFGSDQVQNYAAGFCNKYSRMHDKGDKTQIGIAAGSWWLPSIAELLIIWKHKYAINKCLSVIKGATQLEEGWHWSSTEHSAQSAWHLSLNVGSLGGWYTKSSDRFYVRAVAAFH